MRMKHRSLALNNHGGAVLIHRGYSLNRPWGYPLNRPDVPFRSSMVMGCFLYHCSSTGTAGSASGLMYCCHMVRMYSWSSIGSLLGKYEIAGSGVTIVPSAVLWRNG